MSHKRTMSGPRIIGIQMDLAWEDAAANCARAQAFLDRRRPPAGALIVLPEMFSSGFSMNATAVAEPPGGPTERWLTRTAGRLGLWILAGLARRDSRGAAANEALIAGPDGSLIATYRKQRPFSPGGEHLHYAAGRETLVFPWNDVRVATFICYDLRFSELFRQAARERPELYVVIASWPDRRIAHWLKLLQARAIENQAYVLGLNRVGSDPTHAYPGRSLLVDPWGEILQDAGDAEGLIDAELDLARLRDYRSKLPFLDDLA